MYRVLEKTIHLWTILTLQCRDHLIRQGYFMRKIMAKDHLLIFSTVVNHENYFLPHTFSEVLPIHAQI